MARKRRELSVTGTKRGLGLQFARDLARQGVSVMLTDPGENPETDPPEEIESSEETAPPDEEPKPEKD